MNKIYYYTASKQDLPAIERSEATRPDGGSSKRRGGDRMARLGMPRERDGLGQ